MQRMKAVGIHLLSVFIIGTFQISAVSLSATSDSPSRAQSEAGGDKGKAKKVYTNDDLVRLRTQQDRKQDSGAGSQDPMQKQTGRSARSKKAGNELSLSTYRDLNGHDRSYWRGKIKPLRNELETLDSQIQSLEAKRSQSGPAAGIKVTRSGRLKSNANGRENLDRRIETLAQKRSQVQKSIQDLEEDARKSQALPEWLR